MRRWSKARRRRPGQCACPVVPCPEAALVGSPYCQLCREECLPDWKRRRRNRIALVAILALSPAVAMALTWLLICWGI